MNARRISTLRPADGLDYHAAVTRFLGLPSDIFGTRLPDTGFTQYGGLVRSNFNLDTNTQLLFSYARNQQDNGKRYDQLLGGDGNNIADLRNLMTDTFLRKAVPAEAVDLRQRLVYVFLQRTTRRKNQSGRTGKSRRRDHKSARAHQRFRFQLLSRQAVWRPQHVLIWRRRLSRQDQYARVHYQSGNPRCNSITPTRTAWRPLSFVWLLRAEQLQSHSRSFADQRSYSLQRCLVPFAREQC